jgi:hypothetical protein
MAGFRGGGVNRRIQGSANASLLVASFRLHKAHVKCAFSGLAAMARSGRLAVTDSYNKCVIFFSADGNVVARVGAGKLRGPAGVCCRDDEWIVSDCGADKQRVVFYNADGGYVREFKTAPGIAEPGSVAASERYIAVAAANAPRIVLYRPTDGAPLCDITTTVTEKDTRFLDFTRYQAPSPTDFIQPENCVFDSDDNLYVTFGSAARFLKVYNSKGECGNQFGQWQAATGLHFSPTGKLLIADREDRSVDIKTKNGEAIRDGALNPVTGLNLYPHHMAVLPGNLVVVTVSQNMFSLPDLVQIFQL